MTAEGAAGAEQLPPRVQTTLADYFAIGACCTEVSVDVLTGEYVILRTDAVVDAGQSLNPALDIGQVEGAIVQGIGYTRRRRSRWARQPRTAGCPQATSTPRRRIRIECL